MKVLEYAVVDISSYEIVEVDVSIHDIYDSVLCKMGIKLWPVGGIKPNRLVLHLSIKYEKISICMMKLRSL
jgi:hypothetical protein